jgi:hypothetical protein
VAMLINSTELRATGSSSSTWGSCSRAREDRDCEVLRVWVLKGLFCQWMMTLHSGHDVSE